MANTSTNSYGTVFKMDASGAVITLHFFAGFDGSSPFSRLCQATDGTFYGTTTYGGALGYGAGDLQDGRHWDVYLAAFFRYQRWRVSIRRPDPGP